MIQYMKPRSATNLDLCVGGWQGRGKGNRHDTHIRGQAGLHLLVECDQEALVVGERGRPEVHQVPAHVVPAAQHIAPVQVLVHQGGALPMHVHQGRCQLQGLAHQSTASPMTALTSHT